jgi:hypothetical protein
MPTDERRAPESKTTFAPTTPNAREEGPNLQKGGASWVRRVASTSLVAALVALVACVGNDAVPEVRMCTPGANVFCRCLNREEGTKRCNMTVTAFDTACRDTSGVACDDPPDGGAEPDAGAACVDACGGKGEGATECSVGALFRTCVKQASGCLAWETSPCSDGVTNCADAPKLCAGQCAAGCTLGESACQGDKIQKCALTNGCPVLGAATACTGVNERCIGTKCATACVSNCTQDGARRCSTGTTYQTCKPVAGFPSCLQWSTSTSCGGVPYACQGAGVCAKTCTDECTTSACRSNAYYECQNVLGCNRYVLQDNCPAKDAYCAPIGGGEVACKACNSTCATTPGFVCTSNYSYQYCKADTRGCKSIVTGSCVNCFASGFTGCVK